jgi:multiple sugar transport system substrate-binding protein
MSKRRYALDTHRATRRKVLGSLAAGAGALATYTATGRAFAQDESYELTWATNNLEGTEPEMLQKVSDLFVAANPNYKVTVLKYDGATYDQKLLTDIVAGTLPDLFVSADVYTKPFFDSGLTADLVPLAAEAGFDLTNFDELFLSLAEYEGKIGFLPRAADVVVTYYNKRMFDEAGVPYPNPEWTYDDMLAAAEKLTIKAADGATTQYGVSAATDWWAYWVPMVVAEGGEILNAEGTEAVFNSEAGIRAWNIIFTGLKNGWFIPPSVQDTIGGPWTPFAVGQAAMTFTVRALTPTFRDQLKDDWDVEAVPKGSAVRKTGMGTQGYAISAATDNPTAAFHLLQFIFTEGMVVFMQDYLTVPPIKSFYDDPAWRELPGPPYNNAVFVDATKDAMIPPPLPFYSTGAFRQAMLDGIDAVLLGQMDAEAAVNRMAEEATLSLQE